MIDFLKRAMSEGGEPSSSRLIMLLFAVCSVTAISFYLYKTHVLPTPGDLFAFGGFTISPYTINQIRTVLDTRSNNQAAIATAGK